MKIYVSNLSKKTSEEKLLKAFKKFGEVKSCNIVTEKISGISKGYGFVEMSEIESGEKAIDKLNGSDLDGNAVAVNEARTKSGVSNRESGDIGFGNSRSGVGGKSRSGRNTSRGGNRGS